MQTYWQVGRHIVEFEQGGQARAEYGKRLLLRVDNAAARHWYMTEAATQNWSTRALDRQIGTLYYERLLSSRDKTAVTVEANTLIAAQAAQTTPRDFVRDPVLLEFLGLSESGRLLESGLEQALMDKLQAFLLELGKGFAFVARQQRISTETQDFYIDLVFYNYLHNCRNRSQQSATHSSCKRYRWVAPPFLSQARPVPGNPR